MQFFVANSQKEKLCLIFKLFYPVPVSAEVLKKATYFPKYSSSLKNNLIFN
jgi:hypothetical protein